VSSPLLLLVDDSQAILAFEEAVLGAHYQIAKAGGGREGLRMARQIHPAAMLLDLSMPEMDGEQVLAHMKADPELAAIPVIVVSNEHSRADSCLRAGAADFVPKPIRKETLQAVVARVLEAARAAAAEGEVGVLVLETASVLLAVELRRMRAVALQPETRRIDTGHRFLAEMFHFRGEPIAVLDVASWLGVAHRQPLVDRKLAIVTESPLALCVDDVHEPELVPGSRIVRGEAAAAHHTLLPTATRGIATAVLELGDGVPLVDPAAAVPAALRSRLSGILRSSGPPPTLP
jgi:CheY-like chemotaxis protein/chemotaxis signal transduction protein